MSARDINRHKSQPCIKEFVLQYEVERQGQGDERGMLLELDSEMLPLAVEDEEDPGKAAEEDAPLQESIQPDFCRWNQIRSIYAGLIIIYTGIGGRQKWAIVAQCGEILEPTARCTIPLCNP